MGRHRRTRAADSARPHVDGHVEFVHLRVPEPTGAFAVGKADAVLVDDPRPEPATADGTNGGIAAAEAWADVRIDACLNIDGQLAGGPFSSRPEPSAPDEPFPYLTKETEFHPALAAVFEEAGRDTFRVVVPAASHDEFTEWTDVPAARLPTPVTADDVISVTRGFSLAFFDHILRGAPRDVFAEVDAPTDVQVFVCPLVRPRSGG